MKRISTLIAIVLAAALILPWTSQARAQNAVSFVSRSGSDANTCVATSPCQTFNGALGSNKTADGGTIMCLDVGEFGSAIITRSMTIDCRAGGGGFNGFLFTINAPGAAVRLRNLAFNGLTFNYTPIDIIAAGTVYLENVRVAQAGNGHPGILDHRAGPAVLVIKNSSIVNNTGPGIVIAPASGLIAADLENITSAYNTYGIAVGNGGRVTIKNSFFTNNSVAGIEGDGGSFIEISASKMAFNEKGILTSGSTALSLSQIVSNTTAISGATQSTGNNLIFGNSTDGTAPTIISSR